MENRDMKCITAMLEVETRGEYHLSLHFFIFLLGSPSPVSVFIDLY